MYSCTYCTRANGILENFSANLFHTYESQITIEYHFNYIPMRYAVITYAYNIFVKVSKYHRVIQAYITIYNDYGLMIGVIRNILKIII